MQLKSTFAFDYPPDVIREYLTDQAAIAYITDRHPEVGSLEVLEDQRDGDRHRLDLRYTTNVSMPGPVKKVLGDLNAFVVELIMDTRTHKGTLEITPAKMASKIKAGGRVTFEQQGDKWLQTVEGDVTVSIFGVGKLVEKFIVENFQKSFAEESRLRNEYIRKQREGA